MFSKTVLSRLILLGCAALAVGMALLIVRDVDGYTRGGAALLLTITGGCALVFLYVALRQRHTIVQRLAREMVLVAVVLLVVETLIAALAPATGSRQLDRMRRAAELGIEFDGRTKSQVVAELRDRNIDALPGLSRDWPRQGPVRQQLPPGLFPLSNAANTTIVECNEGGRYITFDSDEYGFNNPPGLFASRDVQIIAVGESFAVGHCVPADRNLLAVVRQSYPRTINLGMAGSSTLSMLASFREYVEPLKPPLVLWVMNPHTADPWHELKDPLLAQYLEPSFTQRLIDRQSEIDTVWHEIAVSVQYEFDRRSLVAIEEARQQRFARIVFLPRLREKLRLDAPLKRPPPPVDLSLFLRSVTLAQQTTRAWGGEFIVVIMPLWEDIVVRQLPREQRHEELAATLTRAGIDVIDAAAVFAAHRKPASLYTLGINNHPNEIGHALLGQTVVRELQKRKIVPLATMAESIQ